MKTFQVIFQNGRVQNLVADRYVRDGEAIRFEVEARETLVFSCHELIMIDELQDDAWDVSDNHGDGRRPA